MMNGIGFSILTVLASFILLSSRRGAALAMMAGVLYLTQAQAIDVGGAHLSGMRLLELTAVMRIILRLEFIEKFYRIDRLVLLLYGYTVLVFLCRSDIDHAYIFGISLDAVLSYFVFRVLITDAADLSWLLRGFALLLVPYVGLLAVEASTKANPFAAIGGLSFGERDGRLRGMGSFRHPSLLGNLGAAFLPLYFALTLQAHGRLAGVAGMSLCLLVVLFANSGGPVSAVIVGAMGWSLWCLRNWMSFVRRSLALMLLLLAVFMKAPLWYLPAKASAFSGGDGWHRSYLMEVAFRDLEQWWLAGMDMNLTQNWFHYTLAATGSADITNQYLYFGLTAGLLAMLLFIALIASAFQGVGKAMVSAHADTPERSTAFLIWGLGCCVAVHVATWFGITYNFDQTYVIWSLQLAAIASMAAHATQALPESEEANTPPPTLEGSW